MILLRFKLSYEIKRNRTNKALYQKLKTMKEIILKAHPGPQEQLIWSYL